MEAGQKKVAKVLINSVHDKSYNHLFDPEEFEVINSHLWQDCDLVLLVGASSDVDPASYNARPIRECGSIDWVQDNIAFDFIDLANESLIPVIGICKGAQQLCVSKGGVLIQHVPRVGTHDVVDHLGTKYKRVPADHHQVMVPARAREMNIIMKNEYTLYPDVVTWDYEHKRDVAIQFHPEWAAVDHRISSYFRKYVRDNVLQ